MKNEQFEKMPAKGIMIKNGIRSIMGNNRKCCVFGQIVNVGIIFYGC